MYREQVNGIPKVQTGRIVEEGIDTLCNAVSRVRFFYSTTIGHTYEITGVEGDYRIIQRDKVATPSDYIARK